MGIFTYIKLGACLAGIIAVSYFVINYKHMANKIKTLEVQVEQQAKVIEWYEKAAKTDKETAEVHNEIRKAVESNDTQRVHDLYERLRQHQRLAPNKAAPPAGP